MTGREAAEYILINRADDTPLVIYLDGQEVQVHDICLEPDRKALVIFPDYGMTE